MIKFELSGKYCVHNGVIILEENDELVHVGMCTEDSDLKSNIERVFQRKNYNNKKISPQCGNP